MKVAMCFSGLPRGNYKENITRFRRIFPDYDFFFSTWRGYEIEGENYTIYEEPKSDYLNALCNDKKIGKKYNAKVLAWGYKQIIGHSLQLLFDVPREYDMIVRCRYDSELNEKIDWDHFVKKSYNRNTIFGFSSESGENSKGLKRWDSIIEITGKYQYARLNDMLIFHKRNDFSSERVFELFRKEILQPCEQGWVQAFPDAVFPMRKYAIKLPVFRCFVCGLSLDRNEEQISLMHEPRVL